MKDIDERRRPRRPLDHPAGDPLTRAPASHRIGRIVANAQHRIARSLGVEEEKRGDTVLTMQLNNARRAPGYWIQLFLSMGIATLGLVLDSTAVVIGGMLVSPLMGPIIELGMGFAVGSSLLVIRAFLRVALSVVVVVAGAAVFTLALPFHEITSEIATRTAPTALDLFVAIFCALTAAYTTVRPGSDTTSAAAGTAIGIALVPPLCTIGFGFGTGSLPVAGGAALLFTANLSAILVFAVLTFFVLGFNQVDAASVELDFVTESDARTDRVATRAHRLLRHLFGSRYGLAMRLLVPALFLAGVFVPLRRALDEVTWEVRSRDAIRRIVAAESPGAVQTSVVVERHTIAIRLLVVGTSDHAATLETVLMHRITAVTGVAPTLSIVPVADARTLSASVAAESRRNAPPTVPPIDELSEHLAAALRDSWPATAGPLGGWSLSLTSGGPPVVIVRHLGVPLGEPGAALLATVLSSSLATPVQVRDTAVPATQIVSRPGRVSAWTDSALTLLASVAQTDSITACLRSPLPATGGRSSDRVILTKLMQSDAAQRGRLSISARGPWMIQAKFGSCAPRDSVAAPPA